MEDVDDYEHPVHRHDDGITTTWSTIASAGTIASHDKD
jgi:hypothetical protein